MFELNKRIPEFNKSLRVESLLVKAFGGRPVRTEKELTQSLSKFPVCKNKVEAKKFLEFGVEMDLVKRVKKKKGLTYEL